MQTSVPIQYSKIGNLVKKFLHTKLGARVGYYSGISGFNRLDVTVNGKSIASSYNSRVDAGAALSASLVSGTTLGGISSPAAAKYIALSTSSLTPAKGDTTLSGETVVSGLGRALATAGSYVAPSVLDGSASYTLTKTFTAGVTGPTVLQSAAIFDAVSTGNMLVEANLSASASLGLNEQIAITWTINI